MSTNQPIVACGMGQGTFRNSQRPVGSLVARRITLPVSVNRSRSRCIFGFSLCRKEQ